MIREATLTDVPALVALGRRFWATSSYATVLAENPTQMAALATRMITEPTFGTVFVSDSAGIINGMIGMVVFAHHLSGERTAAEAFWFSEASGAGVRLLRRAEQWAAAQGATAIQMVAPNERIGAFYEKMGYALIERGYMRSLLHG